MRISCTSPLDCRGNRILALPPARKGRQGCDMTDKCAPHPWAKAQSRSSNGRNIKRILLILHMCTFIAPRDIPDTHTNKTHITSVIYSHQATDCRKTIYQKPTHHNVFFNTEIRDVYPYGSPEGAKRLPRRENDWRQRKRTLGAAMRLHALRQAPPQITRN